MKMVLKLLCIIVLCIIATVASQGIGETCIQDGVPGVCTLLGQCQPVLSNPQSKWWTLHRCGFRGAEPILCCVTPPTTTTQRPVATTPKLVSSTTEYIPAVEEYHLNVPSVEGCIDPIPGVTAAKTGRKAWDKCIEYKESLIYPCKESVALVIGAMSRVNNCRQNADGLIVGGKDANQNEFPHMMRRPAIPARNIVRKVRGISTRRVIGGINAAQGEFPYMVLLGFGESSETAVWQCGGSLVSEKFILTAGHCTWARDIGPVTYAIVGTLKRSDKIDSSQVHRIQRIIKHPQYKAPSKYHDIALLETLHPITLGASAVPVCLDIFGGNTTKATATGWGATSWRGSDANILQKVTLTKFTEQECRTKYPRSRYMEQGFDPETQMCYGDYDERLDTCQGDSGGPLTIPNAQVSCTYIIVGITSFGKACGNPKDPGMYTKLSYYVPWIESVVWP